MTAPTLTTERLVLRPHVLADFEASAALWADPEVVKYIGGVQSNREKSWTRVLRSIGHWQALGYGYWVVCDRSDGSFLGEVGFANFQRQMTPAFPDVPEAGWVLSPKAHGRGLATEAMTCALQWADSKWDWPQIFALFDPEHLASQRVATKLGFEAWGEARYDGTPVQVMTRENSSLGSAE